MANQGCALLNLDQFTQLTTQINACTSGAELQALVNSAMNSILGMQAAVNIQIADLAPFLPYLAFISNPTQAVTFINNLIAHVLIPMIRTPYDNLVLKEAGLVAQIADLTSVINAQAAVLGISITIPLSPHC